MQLPTPYPLWLQGLWKFVAYGDVDAAMNALPRPGETLNGAWTRQDLLYDSDSEDLSVRPTTLTREDSESQYRTIKRTKWVWVGGL